MSVKDNNYNKALFRKYFSDFYKWNVIVGVLFVVAYICGIIWGGDYGKYWLIPVCFLLILLTSLRYYLFYFTARRDLKESRIEKKTVCIQSISNDKRRNYYNRGGGLAGKEKCIIHDSEGGAYRVVIDGDWIIETKTSDYYCGAMVEIEYLEQSRIVLHMKDLASDTATKHLYKDFYPYFISAKIGSK